MEQKDKYPWKYMCHLIFDISLFVMMLVSIMLSYFMIHSNPSSLAFQKSGTLVILIALIIEYRDRFFYNNHVYQSIFSKSLTDDYFNTAVKLRRFVSQSTFYFILLRTRGLFKCCVSCAVNV